MQGQNIIMNDDTSAQKLCEIMDKDKYLIGRIGGVEYDSYEFYKRNGFKLDNVYFRNFFDYCGYYDLDMSEEVYKKFIIIFEKYYANCDIIGIAGESLYTYEIAGKSKPYYKQMVIDDLLKIKDTLKFSYTVLESFKYFDIIFPKLDGKKILIISPFEKEIMEQLKICDKLFDDNNLFKKFKYPQFSKVEYINTFLTTNKFQCPHRNTMETFESYKQQIKDKDFDVALLICGAYSYPIATYILSELNKSAIHLGGIGQLFFGIKGGRYLTTYFEQMMNSNWIYPYQIITSNANGVSNDEALMAYFKRK